MFYYVVACARLFFKYFTEHANPPKKKGNRLQFQQKAYFN